MFREARRCSVEEALPPPDVTERARAQSPAAKRLPPEVVRTELEGMLLGRGVHLALQWMHDTGLLGIWLFWGVVRSGRL